MVFATIGGSGASHFALLRKSQVPAAPISVAILPKIISNSMHPVRVLLMMQPKNNPGIAAGVNTGRMVRASEKRT